jgi:hypothetical protein
MSADAKKKMEEQGFSDAIDEIEKPRFSNDYYMKGWDNAKVELGFNEKVLECLRTA